MNKPGNKPKIVVIGAGSYFFGKQVIWNMVKSEVLQNGTLALVDTNPEILKTMITLAKKVITETNVPAKVIGSVNRREVMKDADFIVLAFSEKNAYYRGVDTRISAKYGVTMCSSDTIGPGGIFRALREIPVALAVAKDMENLCPDAWLINFVNPTAVIGIALRHYAKVRSFALCDGLHEPRRRIMMLKDVGILPADAETIPTEMEAKLDLAIGGVNHCTWMIRFNYDGRNIMPELRSLVAEKAKNELETVKAKPRYNLKYALQLMDLYGAYPIATSHTKEYVPFFQGYGVTPNEPEPIIPFNADIRSKEMAEAWKITEQFANGDKSIDEFMKDGRQDHATDIIESMWGKLGKAFYINSANRGAVTNLPEDAFLELRCDIDMHGPRPQPLGEFPRGLLALQHQVLDTHELTAEAAVTFDKTLLLRAMITDPIVNNIGDAKNIMNELLEAERKALPEEWYQ